MFEALDLSRQNAELAAFVFALVLSRTSAAVVLLPGLAEVEGLPMLRAGVALCLSVLIFPSIATPSVKVPDFGAEVAIQVVAEVITGLAWGLVARVWVQVGAIAAQLAAYMLGLSSILQPDPDLGPQSTAIARLFSLAAPVMILISGLYQLPIRGLCDSYQLTPLGTFINLARISEVGVGSVAMTFSVAVQLVTPLMLAAATWHTVLGLVSRLIPRIQIYFLAVPAQIIGGTLLLSFICGKILGAVYGNIQSGLQM